MFAKIRKKEKFDLYKMQCCCKQKKQYTETSTDKSNSYDSIKENVSHEVTVHNYRKWYNF